MATCSNCFLVLHWIKWAKNAHIWLKNASFGPNLAVYGPKILFFMEVSKSFGTHITEKPPRHLVRIFFSLPGTPILVNGPFVALGETVPFPRWEYFVYFSFQSYGRFRKKNSADAPKSQISYVIPGTDLDIIFSHKQTRA